MVKTRIIFLSVFVTVKNDNDNTMLIIQDPKVLKQWRAKGGCVHSPDKRWVDKPL